MEASARLTLADLLPTGTFLAVSPFITGTVIGGLLAFTAVFMRRTQTASATLMACPDADRDRVPADDDAPAPPPA